MARPAPFTQHPTLPSSLMNVSPAARACTSDGASADASRSAAISGRRSSSLSSTTILASSGTTAPAGVVMSGLISASEAPTAYTAADSFCMMSAAARACATSRYSLKPSPSAWWGSSP